MLLLVAVCDLAPGWYQAPVLSIHLRLAAFVPQNPVAAAPAAVSLRHELEPQHSDTPRGVPVQRHPRHHVAKIDIMWVVVHVHIYVNIKNVNTCQFICTQAIKSFAYMIIDTPVACCVKQLLNDVYKDHSYSEVRVRECNIYRWIRSLSHCLVSVNTKTTIHQSWSFDAGASTSC